MLQQYRERIPPCISSGAQSLESSDVPISMLIPGTGIPPKDRIGLRGYIPSKLLDKLLKSHRQIPFLMFSMACNPN